MNEFEIIDELNKLGVLDKKTSTISPFYLELNDIGYIEAFGIRYVYSNFDGTVSIYFNELIAADNSELLLYDTGLLVGVVECV